MSVFFFIDPEFLFHCFQDLFNLVEAVSLLVHRVPFADPTPGEGTQARNELPYHYVDLDYGVLHSLVLLLQLLESPLEVECFLLLHPFVLFLEGLVFLEQSLSLIIDEITEHFE